MTEWMGYGALPPDPPTMVSKMSTYVGAQSLLEIKSAIIVLVFDSDVLYCFSSAILI